MIATVTWSQPNDDMNNEGPKAIALGPLLSRRYFLICGLGIEVDDLTTESGSESVRDAVAPHVRVVVEGPPAHPTIAATAPSGVVWTAT